VNWLRERSVIEKPSCHVSIANILNSEKDSKLYHNNVGMKNF